MRSPLYNAKNKQPQGLCPALASAVQAVLEHALALHLWLPPPL